MAGQIPNLDRVSMNRPALLERRAQSVQPCAGWVQLERRPRCRCAACTAALRFRLVRWEEPKQLGLALPARRAIVAMSVSWITHQWLVGESGLRAKEVEALLNVLEARGALQTWYARATDDESLLQEPFRCSGGSVLQRLRRWWLSPVQEPH